ncbi:hypothetical protein MM440_15825 [Arsenicicoccus piscis]|uniref:4'-phosphopantetheinyl transferase domain-containing protein n=1 Tax=Arsenicicoccus piscis TaxID=673954 RepID=A0ABQ6HPA2_9MICO|nr:hypothetical protein [Arsenicicoccus piscis]MCH8628739.1 hypothetical protein [Arsenicicoccus piscis]MCH8629202.1 hypothetical protein [Arsenicicoccus piscis]GMA20226.1 hypothetical protein GCM10025862_22470 [Arsenicicoccus piscis]
MTSGRTVAAVGSSESLVAQWSGGSAYPVALRQLLSEAEQQRHDRLRRSNDRRDYLAAHLLVRVLVRGLAVGAGLDHLDPASPLDVAALAAIEIEQRCPTCGRTGHGRPAVVRGPDVAVSWAHADGVVAAAVTPGRTTAIGIDVERIGARSERAAGVSTSTWCRMECAVKAGLTDLDQVLAHGVPPTPGLCWTEHAVDLAGHLTQVTVLAPGVARVCPATPPGMPRP